MILTPGPELSVPLMELKPAIPAQNHPLATLEGAEREYILRALRDTKWVIGGASGAAARLGMKRTTLIPKMIKLNISRPT